MGNTATIYVQNSPSGGVRNDAINIGAGDITLSNGRLLCNAIGSVISPAIGIGANLNDGIYCPGTGSITICRNNKNALNLSNSGMSIYNSSGTYFVTLNCQQTTNATLNIPNIPGSSTDTMCLLAQTQPLANKSLYTSCNWVDTNDNTKSIAWDLSGISSATTLTLASSQSTSQQLNLPNITSTDTLAVLSLAQVMSNKSFSSTCNWVDTSDNTKKIAWSLSGMSANRTLTLASTQSTNQQLNFPNILSTDTIMTVASSQTLTGFKIFPAGSASTCGIALVNANTGLYTTNSGNDLNINAGGATEMTFHSNGQVELTNANSVSAPGLYMLGDSTTGLYRPSANQIGFTISGTNRMTISSSGVKIGANGTNIAQVLTGTGSVSFSSSPQWTQQSTTISFSNSFAGVPTVLVTNTSGGSLGSPIIISVSSVSSTQFTANVIYIYTTTLTQTINFNWLAMY